MSFVNQLRWLGNNIKQLTVLDLTRVDSAVTHYITQRNKALQHPQGFNAQLAIVTLKPPTPAQFRDVTTYDAEFKSFGELNKLQKMVAQFEKKQSGIAARNQGPLESDTICQNNEKSLFVSLSVDLIRELSKTHNVSEYVRRLQHCKKIEFQESSGIVDFAADYIDRMDRLVEQVEDEFQETEESTIQG